MLKHSCVSICCAVLALGGCSKPKQEAAPPVSEKAAEVTPILPSAAAASLDACALLTSAEIESVQEEPVAATKPSVTTAGAFSVSQCYFALPTSTNSVVLTVTQKGAGPDARDPKTFWETTFRGEEEKKEEPGEANTPPVKVEGVGDEAFWTGSALGGALYVLSGDLFIRISIGGAADQGASISKAQALARIVLKRLPGGP